VCMQPVERVDINSVQPDPANSRLHGERNLAQIQASLHRFGQQKPIVVDERNIVIAGNGQLAAAKALGWTHIDIVRTQLTGDDAAAYAIADNRTAELADWNDALLAEQLAHLQLQDKDLLAATGFTAAELTKLIAEQSEPERYTSKIAAPIYEIRGECPDVKDLCNRDKTNELIREIRAAKLPKDIAAFLVFAAERHTAFDFRRIAEFYAHQGPAVQDLMERSALVIIDYQKAIEYGFVRLNEFLGAIADKDAQDEE
jgi:hypothetical protein